MSKDQQWTILSETHCPPNFTYSSNLTQYLTQFIWLWLNPSQWITTAVHIPWLGTSGSPVRSWRPVRERDKKSCERKIRHFQNISMNLHQSSLPWNTDVCKPHLIEQRPACFLRTFLWRLGRTYDIGEVVHKGVGLEGGTHHHQLCPA